MIEFSASSEIEVLTGVLGFGAEVKLVASASLVERLRERVTAVGTLYK